MFVTEEEVQRALPKRGWLRDYVEVAAQTTDAHLLYHVISGLACLTQITLKDDIDFGAYQIKPNLFSLLVGDSGSRKTAAMRCAQRAILEPTIKPSPVLETPASKEALIESLRRSSHMLLSYPEFGAFLANTEQGSQVAMKTALNDVADCVPLGNARASAIRDNKDQGKIEDPRVSLLGGVAPEYLERHTEPVDWAGGFFARFLVGYTARERRYSPRMNVLRKKKAKIGFEKLRTRFKAHREMFRLRTHAPEFAGYQKGAAQLWDLWVRSLEQRETSVRFGASLARAQDLALKIATLLAYDYGGPLLGEEQMPGPISSPQVTSWKLSTDLLCPAILITELHIKSVFAIGEFIGEDSYMRARRRVLINISPENSTSFGQLVASCRMPLDLLKKCLQHLGEEKLISMTADADTGEPGYFRQPESLTLYEAPQFPEWCYNNQFVYVHPTDRMEVVDPALIVPDTETASWAIPDEFDEKPAEYVDTTASEPVEPQFYELNLNTSESTNESSSTDQASSLDGLLQGDLAPGAGNYDPDDWVE